MIKKKYFIRLCCIGIFFLQFHVFGQDENVDKSRDTLRLRDLPWAEKELTNASGLVQSDLYVGRNATEDAFKQNAGRFGIIHLATHVILDDKEPLYSKFVFSKNPESEEDGFLHLYELYYMRLHANMAVLSACYTGTGKSVKGEGMMSLARGFVYAGCPSVVMSLWAIDDKSTSVIVNKFYEGLAQGSSKDAALRDAKLFFINSRDPVLSNPYYWAGLVTIGDTKPLKLTPPGDDGGYWFFSLVAVIFVVTFLTLRKSMTRKKVFLY
ncbi:CHAT domain-containing protein [bacterium]|nr:MAG: CHAT domain-containing protein [bacterium]